jgi:hypothetical protein
MKTTISILKWTGVFMLSFSMFATICLVAILDEALKQGLL